LYFPCPEVLTTTNLGFAGDMTVKFTNRGHTPEKDGNILVTNIFSATKFNRDFMAFYEI
jgi:hypothetical protein